MWRELGLAGLGSPQHRKITAAYTSCTAGMICTRLTVGDGLPFFVHILLLFYLFAKILSDIALLCSDTILKFPQREERKREIVEVEANAQRLQLRLKADQVKPFSSLAIRHHD